VGYEALNNSLDAVGAGANLDKSNQLSAGRDTVRKWKHRHIDRHLSTVQLASDNVDYRNPDLSCSTSDGSGRSKLKSGHHHQQQQQRGYDVLSVDQQLKSMMHASAEEDVRRGKFVVKPWDSSVGSGRHGGDSGRKRRQELQQSSPSRHGGLDMFFNGGGEHSAVRCEKE